ncbi:MAG: phosphopentomutase [Solirubrobacterales bacterium]
MTARVILIVLDSLGVGELPDARDYGDEGSNTLGNMARAQGGLSLPNFQQLGMGNIIAVQGVAPVADCTGSYGKMAEQAVGKDTTTGHWEMMGVILRAPLPVYPNGFPAEVVESFERETGLGVLGNKVASGTVIIEELGAEHMRTGRPIVYTSADSVFQIAAHEDVIPVERLYDLCAAARRILTGDHAVGRVIARPFTGQPGHFVRTERRHDFSVEPISVSYLDRLNEAGIPVTSIGKISDIFAGRGISRSLPTRNNTHGIEVILDTIRKGPEMGFVFANLVDFDMQYGHRNDPEGYAAALAEVDAAIPAFLSALRPADILIFTADHGCDPTTVSTDHSREYVPLLLTGAGLRPGMNLGILPSFADLGCTVADWLGVRGTGLPGISFAAQLNRG